MRRQGRARGWAALLGVLAVVAVVARAAGPADAAPVGTERYAPPVTAPIVDPFRAPPAPWLAGNRGIEFRTEPGTIVRAMGPGVVTFSGTVAGRRWVTIRHPDGLRSSLGPLLVVLVRVGDRVVGGAAVGRAGERLHLGLRRGRTYLDPARYWRRIVRHRRVALLPTRPHRHRRARAVVTGPPVLGWDGRGR